MFHPVCVGLMEGPDYNGFDFYCADCPPPPGKENVQMPPPLTRKKPLVEEPKLDTSTLKNKLSNSKSISSATITPANSMESSKDFPATKYAEPQISITPSNGSKNSTKWPQPQQASSQSALSKSKSLKRPISSVDVSPATIDSKYGGGKSKTNPLLSGTTTLTPVSKAQHRGVVEEPAVSANKKVGPLRPVEAQTVVNIGGIKYLVVPHPTAPEAKNDTKQNEASAKKKSKSSIPRMNDHQEGLGSSNDITRLPFLLRPAVENVENGDSKTSVAVPSFEIEETKDGKLILIPMKSDGGKNIPDCMMRSNESGSKSDEASTKNLTNKDKIQPNVNFEQFTNTLSGGYFAMLNVFQYLTPQERTKSRRVCKLWNQIVQHPSLWESVTLRNCRIYDWKSFAEYITMTHTKHLDVRKILHIQPQETQQNGGLSIVERQALTWNKFANAAPLMRDLERLEMPRIRALDLQKIISGLTQSPHSKLSSISATSILTTVPSASASENNSLDFESFAHLRSLEELKLKAASGPLHLTNLDSALVLMSSNISTRLKKLSLLSVGSGISHKQFEVISQFHNLESLELGDCTKGGQTIPLNKLITLKKLVHLRIERGEIGREVGTLEMLSNLDRLELIDTELKQGFSDGFIRLRKLKQLLLIPSYKDEVATVNSEIVDSVLSMAELNLFILGLTNEWLESMNSLLQTTSSGKDAKSARDSFPILVNGVCEMFSLKKLYKTLTDALPSAQVKILKMPQSATIKQSILGRKL